MTSLCDPFPNLPLSLLTPFPPFVLPCRWVRAAAVRWPSCPQCLEPAGCCWWGWPCPQTIGWSWWRASSYSRTRAWRWRWRCIQASGEFASWLVGRHDDMFEYSLLEDALIHTQKQCCYVCVHMSTSSQQQTHGNRTKRERGGGKRDSCLSQNMFVTCEQDCRDPTWFFFLFLFLHASLTLILKANLNIFSFFLCVFPLRIRKREMCCIRVLHRTRYWDHHWKHCKYPQWVKHITAHYLLCKSLQVWVTEEAPCWLNVGTEIWTPVCNYFD